MDAHSEQVLQRVSNMIDSLTAERVTTIAMAYMAAGFPNPKFAVLAAKESLRHHDMSQIMGALEMSVQVHCFANGFDMSEARLAGKAARNAGVALLTEDLIGRVAYNTKEYGALVDPWFKGFLDLPMERGEAA